MKRFLGSLLLIIAAWLAVGHMSACQTFMLERKLSGDIKHWYREHSIIMDYKLPNQKITERTYFLRLSEADKELYIKHFWDIREPKLKDDWDFRIKVANHLFRREGIEGRYTDRGRILLLCGQPDYEEFFDQDGNLYQEGEEQWGYAEQNRYRWFRKWGYWHGAGFLRQLIWIVFEYDYTRRWRYCTNFDGQERRFMEYWRWRMAPTPEGWEEWLRIIQ